MVDDVIQLVQLMFLFTQKLDRFTLIPYKLLRITSNLIGVQEALKFT